MKNHENILQNYENQPETMNKAMKMPWKIMNITQKSWKIHDI